MISFQFGLRYKRHDFESMEDLCGLQRECNYNFSLGQGKKPPDQANLSRLALSFKISPSVDLSRIPLFLELNPVIASERKRWLVDAVEKFDLKTLSELFPALRKLLGD